MKLRNAAPQWQSLPGDSYSRYWEIDDKRNNSRKAFRYAYQTAFWLWVLNRVSKKENTAKVRSDTRLSQKHVCVEMQMNAKLFWNAFTMCPRKKQNPETMERSCRVCDYYHIYFMKYDKYAFEWYIIEIHPIMLHWAALFSKLNVKNHLCHFQVHVGKGIVIIAAQCGLA